MFFCEAVVFFVNSSKGRSFSDAGNSGKHRKTRGFPRSGARKLLGKTVGTRRRMSFSVRFGADDGFCPAIVENRGRENRPNSERNRPNSERNRPNLEFTIFWRFWAASGDRKMHFSDKLVKPSGELPAPSEKYRNRPNLERNRPN